MLVSCGHDRLNGKSSTILIFILMVYCISYKQYGIVQWLSELTVSSVICNAIWIVQRLETLERTAGLNINGGSMTNSTGGRNSWDTHKHSAGWAEHLLIHNGRCFERLAWSNMEPNQQDLNVRKLWNDFVEYHSLSVLVQNRFVYASNSIV